MTVPQFQLPFSIYNLKKGIVCCLKHWAKAISSDIDVYQEEMISSRCNLHHNNYPECISSAPRNLDWRIENDDRKLTTICLPYVKGLAERIQRICSPYDIRAIFTNGSTLLRYLFYVKPPTEFNMINNCVYIIHYSCGKAYKSKICRLLKIMFEEHRKFVIWGKIEKLGMADHIWKKETICPYGIKLK